ncbi:MAG TPA: sugar ABC transporter permease [Thermomicrobiales bacterium]
MATKTVPAGQVVAPARPRSSIAWERRAFVLPAVIATLAVVIFPTIFGIYVSFTDWQRASTAGRVFNGLDNFRRMWNDDAFWTALKNNLMFVVIGVPIQYVIAFGLALLLNQEIRGRKFFRVVFLIPFMMSPIAIGWMVGRAVLDARYGPVAWALDELGFRATFYDTGLKAVFTLILINAWYAIPFMLVMLLAGLQALPHEVFEAAKIDGASRWASFRDITFPLMLPVSLTAIVLRVVFEFKLIDIIQVVTGGGPGSSSQTLSFYVYKEGFLSGNIGYGTAMAEVFLIFVIIFVTILIAIFSRWLRRVT